MNIIRSILDTVRGILGYDKQEMREEEIIIARLNRVIELLELIEGHLRVTRLIASHSTPVVRQGKESLMRVTFYKRSQIHPSKLGVHKDGDVLPTSFAIIDNEDDTVTVSGERDDGTIVDISGVAALSNPNSDNPTVMTADEVNGMSFVEHALAPGNANVSVTATWADGSVGPLLYTDPVIVSAPPPGPVTKLVVVHAAPTVRPLPPPAPAQP